MSFVIDELLEENLIVAIITSNMPKHRPSRPITPASSSTSRSAVVAGSSFGSTPPPGTIQLSGRRDDVTSSTCNGQHNNQLLMHLTLNACRDRKCLECQFNQNANCNQRQRQRIHECHSIGAGHKYRGTKKKQTPITNLLSTKTNKNSLFNDPHKQLRIQLRRRAFVQPVIATIIVYTFIIPPMSHHQYLLFIHLLSGKTQTTTKN